MEYKIKFPELKKEDLILDANGGCVIERLKEKYEPYYDYTFFDERIYSRIKILILWQNFDDMGFLTMNCKIKYEEFELFKNTYLQIYNEYIENFNKI